MGRHIAFFNIPALGHVTPTLALVEELTRRGHRVSYACVEQRRPLLEAVGATVRSYRSLRPADSDPTVRAPARSGYLGQTLLSFLDEAVNAWAQLAAGYRADPPDLIVYDRMAFAGRVLAAQLNVPTVQLWPMLVSNEYWSLAQLPDAVDPTDPALLTYHVKLESFLAAHCPDLDPAQFLTPVPHRHLSFYPRAFQPAGELFDSSYRFVGPCLRRTSGRWRPPADGPLVLVTLGTIYNADPGFYRCAIEAFAGTPWHVVLAVGERIDVGALGRLPSNMELHRVVPQLDVLAHATALACHAGMGGIMEAMAFGVPVLAVPQTLEQEANAARVEELALGVRTAPAGLTPAVLGQAVELMVKDVAVADGVARMRRQIQAAGGTGHAADLIEDSLH
ncbi:macrolide family glycosyltransferase [Catellatospora methionotrophica]|uniref:macrolide family glycosyltransferase n=1 Tax=Catellatospora methionotrophica TaxID=121620 RepID=UPI0033DD9656